ncbi:MAG: hypothetical protein M3463_13465, partial [Verrucomicrobiota bacterium]|nr:hypothetical protein [Verrucomicrobiota bacterium]
HKLPDGTLTPLHAHMALIAARDGTLYATILYPYTLLKIDSYKVPAPTPAAAAKYLEALQNKLTQAEARLPEITQLAERLAERHLRGGLLGFPWIGATLEQELIGRSGGLINVGFERSWKKDRTAEEKTNDAVIFAWDDAPKPRDLKRLQDEKAKGRFVLGFGARTSPQLAEHAAACDAWIDSGSGEDDRTIELGGGRRAGRTNHFTNAVHGWLLTAEFVAALTRQGKMPPMFRSWTAEDGRAWSERYAGKTQFHDDLTVPPVASGELGRRYLERIRYMLARLKNTELGNLRTMADRIAAELREGRKTVVASAGHMVMNYVGRFDDSLWAANHEVSPGADAQMKSYEKTPEGALVLRLDTNGLHRSVHELFARKQQRVMLITGENPRAEAAIPAGYDLRVDPGIPFGDACVWLDGYPFPILPPSGVMQVAAYESINVEVHARQAAR